MLTVVVDGVCAELGVLVSSRLLRVVLYASAEVVV
jgi:hypothetical protein